MSVLETVYPDDFRTRLSGDVYGPHSYLFRALVDGGASKDWASRQRMKLERALTLADHHGALDADMIARLKSPDPETFWSKLSELKVGCILDDAGIAFNFDPAGRGSSIGDFRMSLSSGDVFIEVKTLFPQPADRQIEQTQRALQKAARQVALPLFLSIWVHNAAERPFKGAPFRRFLEVELPKAARSDKRSPALRYSDSKSGVVADVTLVTTYEGDHVLTGAVIDSPVSEDIAIRRALESTIRQVPGDKFSLVVICSQLGGPIDEIFAQSALYGRFVVVQQSGGRSGGRYKDGFFQPSKNRRISAVAFLDDFGVDQPDLGHLDIFHNPWAAMPIDHAALLPVSDRQCRAEATLVKGQPGISLSYPYQPASIDSDDGD